MAKTGYKNLLTLVASTLIIGVQGCSDGGNTSGNSTNNKGSTLAITGTVQYEDREYNQSGFTGQKNLKPVRFADVELVRNSDGTVLGSTTTNASGSFSISFSNTGAPGVYIRILSRTNDPLVNVEVAKPSGTLYGVVSNTLVESTATSFTVSLTAPMVNASNEAIGGAFHIMDLLVSGSEFARALTGTVPDLVKARWELGSTSGTYYNSGTDEIYILGGNGIQQGDHDEYDDSVILHEYGHHVAKHFSKDDSPGGTHFLSDNAQDIRLAWSEGWATFFGEAVLNNAVYIDTVGGDPPGNSASVIDLETRGNGSSLIYTTNEGAVATVLWDIFDQSIDESFDAIGDKITQIWDIFDNALVTATSVDMEDFWDGWFTRGHGLETEMRNVTTDRQMEFTPDPSGSNSTASCSTTVTIDNSIHETLYTSTTSSDTDYFCVVLSQGTSYTLQTLNLSNGADTYLELLDAQLNVLTSNDNGTDSTDYSQCQTTSAPGLTCPSNSSTALASRLTFAPSSTGQYVARVTRSSRAPQSAGRYGSYNFRVTTP